MEIPAYRAYITGSRGELSAAKHAYVKTWSGWFSDRSVCYLAAGLCFRYGWVEAGKRSAADDEAVARMARGAATEGEAEMPLDVSRHR